MMPLAMVIKPIFCAVLNAKRVSLSLIFLFMRLRFFRSLIRRQPYGHAAVVVHGLQQVFVDEVNAGFAVPADVEFACPDFVAQL
jgi:hypothetical protein